MTNYHYPVSLKYLILGVSITALASGACLGQAVTARALAGTNTVKINIAAGQRMEFVSLEPFASFGEKAVRISSESYSSVYRGTSPQWRIQYTNPKITVRSDSASTNVMTSVFDSFTGDGAKTTNRSTTTTVVRKTIPNVIVGPATFQITPVAGRAAMLNYRLRANN
jgi:hypothetical protein